MSQTVPTVKIVSPSAPGGFVIINESDLKADHEIWTGDAKASGDQRQTSDAPAGNVARPTFSLTPGAAKKNR